MNPDDFRVTRGEPRKGYLQARFQDASHHRHASQTRQRDTPDSIVETEELRVRVALPAEELVHRGQGIPQFSRNKRSQTRGARDVWPTPKRA